MTTSDKLPTRKEALLILLEAASRDYGGQGMGFRTTSDAYRARLLKAVKRLWKEAHGKDFDDNDKFNFFRS
jgi:hypothetical protein